MTKDDKPPEPFHATYDAATKTVLLATPGGLSIRLDDLARSITLADCHGNSIVMGAEGIAIDSVGDIRMTAQLSISLGAATINTAAAASARIDGGGMLELKGGMVKLN